MLFRSLMISCNDNANLGILGFSSLLTICSFSNMFLFCNTNVVQVFCIFFQYSFSESIAVNVEGLKGFGRTLLGRSPSSCYGSAVNFRVLTSMSCVLCALRSAVFTRNVSNYLARPIYRSFVSTSRTFNSEVKEQREFSGVIRKPRLEERVTQEEAKRTILIRGIPEFVQEQDIREFLGDDGGVEEIMFG